MKSIDLNLLRVLDAVLDEGSVTAAAQRLHLSVPATSHALSRVREALGDPLLVRAGRALVPTPRALALREPLARWLAQAESLVARPGTDSLADLRRRFVVRGPEGMVMAYGAALAEDLHRAMPASSLRFVADAEEADAALREGRIDLDIGLFRPAEPEIETLELLRQWPVALTRPGHPIGDGALTPERYAAHPHVDVQRRPGPPSPVDAALARHGCSRRVLVTVPQAIVAALMTTRSDLVATLSERMARAMAAGLPLQVHPLAFDVEPDVMIMAWHPRVTHDPAHRWLRERLLSLLRDSQAP